MDRRDFLQFMMVCYAQPRLTDDIASQFLRSQVGGSYGRNAQAKAHDKGSGFLFVQDWIKKTRTLRHIDWSTYESRDYPIPLGLPHSLVQDPSDPEVVYIFETFGSFARLELKTGASVVVDHSQAKSMSYGHATFASTGELLCTEVDPDQKNGRVSIRNPKTLELLGNLPSECGGSHQIASMPGTKLAVCGVATEFGRGDEGAVVFTDSATKKTRGRVVLPSSISHVIPISGDEVIALGLKMNIAPINPVYGDTSLNNTPDAARTATFDFAPIYKVKTDGTYSTFPTTGLKDLFKFNFAFLKIPHSELCVTSHLGSQRVIVWNGAKPVKILELPYPTNLTASADGSEFMVVTNGKVKIYSSTTFEEKKTLGYTGDVTIVGLAGYKR